MFFILQWYNPLSSVAIKISPFFSQWSVSTLLLGNKCEYEVIFSVTWFNLNNPEVNDESHKSPSLSIEIFSIWSGMFLWKSMVLKDSFLKSYLIKPLVVPNHKFPSSVLAEQRMFSLSIPSVLSEL